MQRNEHNLTRYLVRLKLYGVKKQFDPNAVAYIEEELSMRPHITAYAVTWNDESGPVNVDLGVAGLNEKETSLQAAEELFEVAGAILNDIDGMHVEVHEVIQVI